MKHEITHDELIAMYNDMLDEIENSVFNIEPHIILEECDPIQYNMGLNDYYDSLTYDNYYCEEME